MEEKTQGIVLSKTEYGESDRIVNIFTPDLGVISSKMKGVKKAGAKLKFASEPFCFAEFVFTKKGEYRTVISASLIDSFYPLREDLIKLYSGSAVLEFIRKFLKEEIISSKTFFLSLNTLKEIAYGDNGLSALCNFFFNALSLTGYGLSLFNCLKCGREINERPFFDFGTGGFYHENCRDEHFKEINFLTYSGLKDLERGENIEKERAVLVLRFFNYYVKIKSDESIFALAELLKLTNS